MTTTLPHATEKLHTAEQALLERRTELAKLAEAADPIRARLSALDAQPVLTAKDMLEVENLRRQLRQLDAHAAAGETAVASATVAVTRAQVELKQAAHEAMQQKVAHLERALMEEASEVGRRFDERLTELRKLRLEAGVLPGTIGLKLEDATLGTPLQRVGAGLKLWTEFERHAASLKAPTAAPSTFAADVARLAEHGVAASKLPAQSPALTAAMQAAERARDL